MSRSSTIIDEDASGLLEPIHPGEILLEEFMKPLGLSQNRLAREIGVPVSRVAGLVKGERSITADTALRRWNEDLLLCVEHDATVDRDAAFIGTQQSGNGVDDAGLAGAGAAEQSGDAGVGGRERGIQYEIAEPVLDGDVNAHAVA